LYNGSTGMLIYGNLGFMKTDMTKDVGFSEFYESGGGLNNQKITF